MSFGQRFPYHSGSRCGIRWKQTAAEVLVQSLDSPLKVARQCSGRMLWIVQAGQQVASGELNVVEVGPRSSSATSSGGMESPGVAVGGAETVALRRGPVAMADAEPSSPPVPMVVGSSAERKNQASEGHVAEALVATDTEPLYGNSSHSGREPGARLGQPKRYSLAQDDQ